MRLPAHGDPLDVDARHRFVTAASVWIIRDGTYIRLPQSETPREPLTDVVDDSLTDDSLTDATKHEHRGGRWEVDPLV